MSDNIITGTFTATGVSPSFTPRFKQRQFNFALWGAFATTIRLEKSFDGLIWCPITANGTGLYTFTAPCCESGEEFEPNVQYRWHCTAYTSGTVSYRLSQ